VASHKFFGLDLCYGRYDNHKHSLVEERNFDKNYLWPGIDYANNRINDFSDVESFLNENVDRDILPRMPWHDIMVYLRGAAVSDLVRHFVERWNFARSAKKSEKSKNYDIQKSKQT
jgi:phosphatidylserine/phosphatidylglycerophosphate/cardiolipin synthase-like enzyme